MSTNIICNHCGSNIQVEAYYTYATCPACKTHLQIVDEDNTISTIIVKERGINIKPVPTLPIKTIADYKQDLIRKILI